MIKLIGATMIIFSAIILSVVPLCHQKYRMRILQDFLRDFRFIHTELRSNLKNVPELIDDLAKAGGTTTKTFYQIIHNKVNDYGAATFHDEWYRNLKSYSMYLDKEEYDLVLNIGDILGRYILEEQLAALEYLLQTLEKSYETEKSIYPEKRKLNIGIGTSLGVTLVILLI